MDYYIIYQDERIPDFVEPIGIPKSISKELMKKEHDEYIDEIPIQFYIKDKKENIYIDYIENSVALASDKLKQILENFQEDIFYKPVVLADIKRMKQDLYWLIAPKYINCISEKSQFNKNGTLKKLVIDESKVGFNRVFKVEGILEEFILISLDLAESILRRDFTGIRLRKVEKE